MADPCHRREDLRMRGKKFLKLAERRRGGTRCVSTFQTCSRAIFALLDELAVVAVSQSISPSVWPPWAGGTEQTSR